MRQNKTNSPDTLPIHPDRELGQVSPLAKWYEKYAAGKRREYLVLQIPALIVGIVLPVLVIIRSSGESMDWFSKLTIGVSLLVVILTSIGVFSRYGRP